MRRLSRRPAHGERRRGGVRGVRCGQVRIIAIVGDRVRSLRCWQAPGVHGQRRGDGLCGVRCRPAHGERRRGGVRGVRCGQVRIIAIVSDRVHGLCDGQVHRQRRGDGLRGVRCRQVRSWPNIIHMRWKLRRGLLAFVGSNVGQLFRRYRQLRKQRELLVAHRGARRSRN